MAGFDKSKFLAASKNIGNFEQVPAGRYTCTLQKANYNLSKASSRPQLSFIWRVSDEDSEYPGKIIGVHVGLNNDKGYEIAAIILSQLGLTNMEEVAENFNEALEAVLGTVARLKVTYTRQDSKEYQQVRIDSIIESPLDVAVQEDGEDQEDENVVEEPPFKSDLVVGDVVTGMCNNELVTGTIHTINEMTGVIVISTDKGLFNCHLSTVKKV